MTEFHPTATLYILLLVIYVEDSQVILEINDVDLVHQFICRVCPVQCHQFVVSLSSVYPVNTVELSSKSENHGSSNVTVFISSGSKHGLIYGFKSYLERYCHVSYDQFGISSVNFDMVDLNATRLSFITNSMTKYYGNICQFSYSSWWWTWHRWERHIDWIVFQGFNLAFVPTGVELVNFNLFQKLGLSEAEILGFFNGPAYLAWSRMGNMKGFTAPLTKTFLLNQVELQKNITNRLVGLGVSITVPGFSGFVPSELTRFYNPRFFNDVSCWLGFNSTYSCIKQIDPTSDLYVTVGQLYMKELYQTLHHDHFYAVDMFNENTPKSTSLDYLRGASVNIIAVLKLADPLAIWVVQGWTFGYDSFWINPRIHAYLSDVDNNDIIILDMYAEQKPMWQKTSSFFGKPFVWSLINNFGGNTILNGNIEKTVSGFAYAYSESNSIIGFGFMPEGIYQNTVLFDAVMQYATYGAINETSVPQFLFKWRHWVSSYRYGMNANSIVKDVLEKLYAGSNDRYYKSCIIPHRPDLNIVLMPTSSLQDNVNIIYKFLDTIEHKEYGLFEDVFVYDLATIVQNFAELLFFDRYTKLVQAYKHGHIHLFIVHSQSMKKVITLLDEMNSFVPLRSIPCYLDKVEEFALKTNMTDIKLKHDFLLQLSIWGPDDTVLDYAFKMWSGLLNYYYGKRWDLFFHHLQESMKKKIPFDRAKYDIEVSIIENALPDTQLFGRCKQSTSKNLLKIVSLVKQLLQI